MDNPTATRAEPHPTVDAGAPHPSRIRLTILLAVYLVLLAWIVLWKLDVPWVGGVDRVIKLVPFVRSSENGASPPVEVAVNLLLFVPFGLYLGLLKPAWEWWRVAGVVAAGSLALEVAQYALAVGSTDVTDLIVNTAGGLVGFGLLVLLRRSLKERTVAVLTRACTIGTVLFVLACGLFIASPLHFGPPPGGMPGV